MTKCKTIYDLKWPSIPDDFIAIANEWSNDASNILCSYIWKGYELLKEEVLDQIELSQSEEELERSITQLLEPCINRVMTGYEPFYVQHGPYEYETRKDSPAQPPQYDIAFVLRINSKIMWPCEAKVLHTDGSVSEYIKDIHDQFLTCRYAPFSSGGAMIGYLISGRPQKVFENLEKKIPCNLIKVSEKNKYSQRYSDHKRQVKTDKNYPSQFRLRHIILKICKIDKN
jgi:hypothetical protein